MLAVDPDADELKQQEWCGARCEVGQERRAASLDELERGGGRVYPSSVVKWEADHTHTHRNRQERGGQRRKQVCILRHVSRGETDGVCTYDSKHE